MAQKQTTLIAGATGNIGGGAALALARRGARVVLLGRRPETLEARADSIRVALSEAQIACEDGDIATLVVDFSDMESVRLAAAEALDRFPSIHGLVLSSVALVQGGPHVLPSGHELMFATNVMGRFCSLSCCWRGCSNQTDWSFMLLRRSTKNSTGRTSRASGITGRLPRSTGPRPVTERSPGSCLEDAQEGYRLWRSIPRSSSTSRTQNCARGGRRDSWVSTGG